jgi:hypothetical protein
MNLTQPSTHHITHVYHTADPVPMGTCTGVLSSCALGGYALESRFAQSLSAFSLCLHTCNRCHFGKTILYDTVSNLSWAVDIRTHGIIAVIEKILSEPWAPSVEVGREVPEAKPEDDCVVSTAIAFSLLIGKLILLSSCRSVTVGNMDSSRFCTRHLSTSWELDKSYTQDVLLMLAVHTPAITGIRYPSQNFGVSTSSASWVGLHRGTVLFVPERALVARNVRSMTRRAERHKSQVTRLVCRGFILYL